MSHPPPTSARDVASIADRWRAVAQALMSGRLPPRPDDTPVGELCRTPAAARVATLATEAGLHHVHFEHRLHLALPAAWVPPGDDALAEPPAWELGVLAERKYQSFRHDLARASYHPHHRAKWAVHELCHGLVGFAWRPDATALFHATAGRLAELLPVALWYFLDEAFLRRCPDHDGDGALFRTHCPRCEACAAATPDDPDAEARIADGLRFVDRELAAIARSRRLGRPIPHRWATIDLASDGTAYALAHGRRLADPRFARWVERYAVAGGGWSPTLDALEARVLDVLGALTGERAATPLAPTPAHGAWRWRLQDLGWRLLHLAALHGDARLDAWADGVAEAIGATTDRRADPAGAAAAVVHPVWAALALPGAPVTRAEVFALGAPWPGLEPVAPALTEGIVSATPLTAEVLGDRLERRVEAFAASDRPRRVPLAWRWSRWLDEGPDPALADLARWEATVATASRLEVVLPAPPADARRRLASGVQLRRFHHDVLALAERVDLGSVELDGVLRAVAGSPLRPEPTALLVFLDADDALSVLDVDPATADALEALGDGAVPDLPDDELDALTEHGVLVPVAFAETVDTAG